MGHFLPLYPPNSPKKKNLQKMKQTSGDIIILHKRTKNYDQMMYSSWDMVGGRFNCYISFWAIFPLLYTPLKAKKNQNFEKMKKMPGDIIILDTYTKNYDQKMYSSWDMLCDRWTDRWMDGWTDGKSDIERWVHHLKIWRCY